MHVALVIVSVYASLCRSVRERGPCVLSMEDK